MSDYNWWENDTAGMLVLPMVIGPDVPFIPVSDVERCEMSAYERLAVAVENGTYDVPTNIVPNNHGIA